MNLHWLHKPQAKHRRNVTSRGMQLDREKNLVGFSESSPSDELGLGILTVINQRTGLEPATKGLRLASSFCIWSIEKNTRYDFSILKTYSVFFFTAFTIVFPSASPFPSGMLSFYFPMIFYHQIGSFFESCGYRNHSNPHKSSAMAHKASIASVDCRERRLCNKEF